MGAILYLLGLGWLTEAAVSSIPWLVTARGHLWQMAQSPRILPIILLHVVGAASPLVAAVCLLRGRIFGASLALGLVSGSWLIWHLAMFGSVSAIVRDSPRILLGILTLAVISVRCFRRVNRRP